MNFKRDVGGYLMNFTQMVLAALLIGTLYWQLGYTQEAAQSRAGFVSFCVIGYIMTQINNMAHRFPKQKLVFLRDRQSRLYGVPSFYTALVITEIIPTTIIPIINTLICYWMVDVNDDLTRFLQFTGFSIIIFHVGISAGMMLSAICPNTDITLGVGPLLGIVWVLLGGFWIHYNDIPGLLQPLSVISPATYATKAWMSIMFWGTTFTCDPSTEACYYQTGEDVLVAYGMDGVNLNTCAIMLGILWVCIHLLGACFLQITDLLYDKKWMSQFTKRFKGKVSPTTTPTTNQLVMLGDH